MNFLTAGISFVVPSEACRTLKGCGACIALSGTSTVLCISSSSSFESCQKNTKGSFASRRTFGDPPQQGVVSLTLTWVSTGIDPLWKVGGLLFGTGSSSLSVAARPTVLDSCRACALGVAGLLLVEVSSTLTRFSAGDRTSKAKFLVGVGICSLSQPARPVVLDS